MKITGLNKLNQYLQGIDVKAMTQEIVKQKAQEIQHKSMTDMAYASMIYNCHHPEFGIRVKLEPKQK